MSACLSSTAHTARVPKNTGWKPRCDSNIERIPPDFF